MDNSIRKGYHTPLIPPWLSASDVVIHIDDTQPLIGIAAHITLVFNFREREFFFFSFLKIYHCTMGQAIEIGSSKIFKSKSLVFAHF